MWNSCSYDGKSLIIKKKVGEGLKLGFYDIIYYYDSENVWMLYGFVFI